MGKPLVRRCPVNVASPWLRTGLGNDVARRALTEEDIREIVAREHDEHRVAAEEMRRAGATARAQELRRQSEVLAAYLR